jgi:hypothetical protein
MDVSTITVVVLDLEQHLDAVYGQNRTVVLAIRIIVPGECIESRHRNQDTCNTLGAQCLDPGRDHDPTAASEAAELIVQGANAG